MRAKKTSKKEETETEEKQVYMSSVQAYPLRWPPTARVPRERPKERRRNVIPAEVVSTARDATGLLLPWQPRSPEQPAGGVCEAPARSGTASRPACTALAARPR